jgi:hypothetical protein
LDSDHEDEISRPEHRKHKSSGISSLLVFYSWYKPRENVQSYSHDASCSACTSGILVSLVLKAKGPGSEMDSISLQLSTAMSEVFN